MELRLLRSVALGLRRFESTSAMPKCRVLQTAGSLSVPTARLVIHNVFRRVSTRKGTHPGLSVMERPRSRHHCIPTFRRTDRDRPNYSFN